MANGIRQPYMHIEEIAPWLQNPPTDEELKRVNQTREEANKQAQEVERQREQTFSKMSSGVYVVTVKGAVHNSFSDMPIIMPERYSNLEINAARALAITNAYILAFFDRHLRGRRQTLLEGNAPRFPEVTLQVYRPKKASLHPVTPKSRRELIPGNPEYRGTSRGLIVHLTAGRWAIAQNCRPLVFCTLINGKKVS
jgi:hypothetical protein